MSNIDKQAVTAKTKELASLMVERFSMNPVSCKLLNEAWKKEFPDEVAIAERMLALLDENIQLQREKDAIEAVALALRDDMRQAREKLEAAERSIAELERSETQLINERDYAESALNDAYKAVMGQAPEWSNWFSFENAIEEIELACELWRNQTDDVIQFRQRIAELEAREVNLSKLSVGEVMHMSGFSRDYAEGWCAGNDNAIHEIRTAGIKVKGE